MKKILVNLFEQQFGPNKYNEQIIEAKKTQNIPGHTECSTSDLRDLYNSGRLKIIKYLNPVTNKIDSISSDEYLKINNVNNFKGIKDYYLAIQVFNSGFRWTNDDDYNYWSGIIFVDIDSKNYNKEFDFDDFENRLFLKLQTAKHVKDKFYCMQRSASGNSLHVFFYFDWKKIEGIFSVEELFRWLAAKCMGKVADLMGEIGYEDMAKTKGVLDDCSKKPAQPIFLTPSELKFNNIDFYGDSFGDMLGFDVSQIIPSDKSISTEVNVIFEDTNNLEFKVFPKIIKSWGYENRFALTKVFVRFFGKDRKDEAVEWYSKIVPYIRDEYNKTGGNKYTDKQLITQFKRDYPNIIRGIEKDEKDKQKAKKIGDGENVYFAYKSVSSKMLVFFETCFNIKARREGVDEIIKCSYSNEILLIENQKYNEYIGDYMFEIKTHVLAGKNVYIQADCGTGKSYFFRELLDDNEIDKVIIVCHLNSIKDSVYADEISNENVDIPSSTDIRKYCRAGKLPDKMIIGWNQLKELSKFSDKIDLSDYVKCFDEIHNIVATLSYRHSVIYDIVRWKELQKKCICVSATPCGEFSLFCPDSVKYSFKKAPKYSLNTYSYNPKLLEDETGRMNILPEMIRIIGDFGFNGGYDKIVVFDNVRHPEIYHAWRTEALHYCKDMRKDKHVIDLQKTNNLKEKVFVTTTYGTEGIEIKNNVNKVLFIIPLRSSVTKTVVTQLLNRFRNMKHADIIFIGTGSNNLRLFEEDGPVLTIINEIKQNNPDFMEWKEKENYYLSAWMYWKNTDLDNEKLDLFPKLVMLYHNYLLNQSLTQYNIHNFYPDIKYSDFLTEREERTEIKDHLDILGRFPNLAFEAPSHENAIEILNNYIEIKDHQKNSPNNDIFNLDKVSINPVFSDFVKNPSLHGKLIRTMQMIQNAFIKLKPDFRLDLLHYNNNKEQDQYKNVLLWNQLVNLNEYKFIIQMVKMFRTTNLRFKPSAFHNFFIIREKIKSKPITDKQKEQQDKEIAAYKSFIKKWNLKDDLSLNVFDSLWDQIKDLEIDQSKRNRKGKAIGKAVGKAINKIYTLIDNPFIEFHTHEECWKYATDNLLTNVNLGTWVKKGIWKKFFIKN